jgi:hypothetical protein
MTEKVVTRLDVAPGVLAEYYDWVKGSQHGDVLVYWTGDLQFDRSVAVPFDDVMRSQERLQITSLNIMASRVLDDAKDGLITLTQKRLGQNQFEYRATRVRRSYGTEANARNDNLVTA